MHGGFYYTVFLSRSKKPYTLLKTVNLKGKTKQVHEF